MTQQPSWFSILLVICFTIITFLFGLLPKETHVKTFCAYNRMFIEFTEGRNTWGTMMLDRVGAPIPCAEDEEIKSSTKLIRT